MKPFSSHFLAILFSLHSIQFVVYSTCIHVLQGAASSSKPPANLPPLEVPKSLQDVKTDLVQLFLTNMASDEVQQRIAVHPSICS